VSLLAFFRCCSSGTTCVHLLNETSRRYLRFLFQKSHTLELPGHSVRINEQRCDRIRVLPGSSMGNQSLDDAELMFRLREGDMAALGHLAERHQSHILSLSFRLLGDWHRAEDVMQEVFLRLRQAARTYRPEAKFTTWLYRIVYNLSIDHQRKFAREPVSLEDGQVPAQAEACPAAGWAQKKELAGLVRAAINGLSERQRHVIILHRYEGLSHAEISEVTGWSKSAVESLLVRAYENLRKKLAACEDSAA